MLTTTIRRLRFTCFPTYRSPRKKTVATSSSDLTLVNVLLWRVLQQKRLYCPELWDVNPSSSSYTAGSDKSGRNKRDMGPTAQKSSDGVEYTVDMLNSCWSINVHNQHQLWILSKLWLCTRTERHSWINRVSLNLREEYLNMVIHNALKYLTTGHATD